MMHLSPAGVLAPQRSDPTVHPLAFSIILVGLSILFGLFYVCSISLFLVGVRPRSTELLGASEKTALAQGAVSRFRSGYSA